MMVAPVARLPFINCNQGFCMQDTHTFKKAIPTFSVESTLACVLREPWTTYDTVQLA